MIMAFEYADARENISAITFDTSLILRQLVGP